MPKPPELGHLYFDPPLIFGSPRYRRAWKLIKELGVQKTVVFRMRDMNILGLSFDTKDQAMLFRLSLD